MLPTQLLKTPRPGDLGLALLRNAAGFEISRLPNGAVFSMEHVHEGRRIMVNRTLGSPLAGSMSRIYQCAQFVISGIPIIRKKGLRPQKIMDSVPMIAAMVKL